MSKKPTPLENLPQYLKSLRKNGNTGDAPVVDMGNIISKKRSSFTYWSQQAILTMMLFVIVGLGGIMSYNIYEMTTVKQFTVIMDIDNDNSSKSITKIVSDIGGEVVAVKKNSNSSYEVEVSTRKSKHSFLGWLRKNKDVRKADLEVDDD